MKNKNKLNIAILTQVNSRSAGGLFNSVKNLALQLRANSNINIGFFSYNDKYSNEDIATYKGLLMTNYKVIEFGRLRISLNLYSLLNRFKPVIIHQHGIWMSYSWVSLFYQKINPNVKTIITPRGMLDSWAVGNSSKKKRIAGLLYENKNLEKADCILALCHSEYLAIRKFGLKNPVAIIPNGINLPKIIQTSTDKSKVPIKTLLFIGRIHPKKGLVNFINGLGILLNNNKEILDRWRIRIAGWSELGHQKELETLTESLGLSNYITFVGPVYGEKKEHELLIANMFILPSFSEGLPMSVLEAWAYKLPVVMTAECNLSVGFDVDSAVQVKLSPLDISLKLEELFKVDNSRLIKMGNNGYELVKEKYTWSKISEETIILYRWLLDGGEKPSFVKLK